jgi:hypothetical protein
MTIRIFYGSPARRTTAPVHRLLALLLLLSHMGLVPIDLLPQGIDENVRCGRKHLWTGTYEINGPVAYLGRGGDLHQLRYNYLKQSGQSFRGSPPS